MKLADRRIFDAFGVLNGHSLKRLLAAMAACLLLVVIRARDAALSFDSLR